MDFDGLNGADYIDYTFELLSAGSLEGFDVDDANANFVAKICTGHWPTSLGTGTAFL